jgi:putative hydrolase of HD superfamily
MSLSPSTTATNMNNANNANNDDLKSAACRAIDFLTLSRGLKTQPRTGWVRQEAGPRIESVADHSWRISLMAMVAGFATTTTTTTTTNSTTTVDTNKCIQMALVHDLAEATVGDITPYCGVSDQDKHEMELLAMTKLTTGLLGTSLGAEMILSLWKEYEEGTTEEAKLVKDMDKLEMILQALEYETDGENKKSLDGFFDSTRGKWRTSIGEAWGQEIESRRNKQQGQE